MKLLYIGKYPPIQGGTSAASFWRMEEYKNYNIDTQIITAIKHDEYATDDSFTNLPLHIINTKMTWHIPYTQLFSERIISKGIDLAKKNNFDVIEGNYLFPYGFAAYIIAKTLSKPLILRHAGSDLFRLATNHELYNLTKEMLHYSSLIVTYDNCRDFWRNIKCKDLNLRYVKRYVPNLKLFKPREKNGNAIFMGKITEKWDINQLDSYYKSLKAIHFDGKIIIYSSSLLANKFSSYFRDKHFNVEIKKFVHPRYVPDIISHASYVLVSKIPEDVIEQSNIISEAYACGCKLIGQQNDNITFTGIEDYNNYILEQISLYKLC